jgi:hypothetical protein
LEIPSLEMLGKMKDALSQRNHLKLDKDKDVQATFKESQIGKKRVKSIEKILVKPESYYFVQY